MLKIEIHITNVSIPAVCIKREGQIIQFCVDGELLDCGAKGWQSDDVLLAADYIVKAIQARTGHREVDGFIVGRICKALHLIFDY